MGHASYPSMPSIRMPIFRAPCRSRMLAGQSDSGLLSVGGVCREHHYRLGREVLHRSPTGEGSLKAQLDCPPEVEAGKSFGRPRVHEESAFDLLVEGF